MFAIQGKVAMITGAAQGIGFCIAKELLLKGAKGVALLDIDLYNGKKAVNELKNAFAKDRVIFIHMDVSRGSQFEDAFRQTIQIFHQLDIVVNNAGILQEVHWEQCIAVNLQGCITGSLLALDTYFPRSGGEPQKVILNVSSVLGLFPFEYEPVYAATKQGVIAFTKALSGPHRNPNPNVKILTICPSSTETSRLFVTSDQQYDEFYLASLEHLSTYVTQSAEEVARHAVSIMQGAESGSVWIISANEISKLDCTGTYDPPR